MTACPAVAPVLPDWRRVAAFGSSFSAHLAAALLITLPLTALPLRHTPAPAVAVLLREIEPPPPPVQPPPPEPKPLPRSRPQPRASLPVPSPTRVDAPAERALPAPTIAAPAAVAPAEPPASAPAAGGGETRVLAYAEPLRLKYPSLALRQRLQGQVMLRVLVDADGAVQRVELERSSGHAPLDAAAREAVSRARFRPVLRDGQAIPAWGLVPIAFRLDRA